MIYALLDDEPVVNVGCRAWAYRKGKWIEIHAGKAGGATVVTESLFWEMFPQLPAMPVFA